MQAAAESVCLVCFFADQRLDLNKLGPNDNDTVRGQIVGKKHTHTHTQFYLHTACPSRKCYYMCRESQAKDKYVYSHISSLCVFIYSWCSRLHPVCYFFGFLAKSWIFCLLYIYCLKTQNQLTTGRYCWNNSQEQRNIFKVCHLPTKSLIFPFFFSFVLMSEENMKKTNINKEH